MKRRRGVSVSPSPSSSLSTIVKRRRLAKTFRRGREGTTRGTFIPTPAPSIPITEGNGGPHSVVEDPRRASASAAPSEAAARELNSLGLVLFDAGIFDAASDLFREAADAALPPLPSRRGEEDREAEGAAHAEAKSRGHGEDSDSSTDAADFGRHLCRNISSAEVDPRVIQARELVAGFVLHPEEDEGTSWLEDTRDEAPSRFRFRDALHQRLPSLLYQRGQCDSGLRPILCPLPMPAEIIEAEQHQEEKERRLSILAHHNAAAALLASSQVLSMHVDGEACRHYRQVLSVAVRTRQAECDRYNWDAISSSLEELDAGNDDKIFSSVVFMAYANISTVFYNEGKCSKALRCLRTAARIADSVLATAPEESEMRSFVLRSLVYVHCGIGRIHLTVGDEADAAASWQECLCLLQSIVASAPPSLQEPSLSQHIEEERLQTWDTASVLHNLGILQDLDGQRDEARKLLGRATELLRSFRFDEAQGEDEEDPLRGAHSQDLCTVISAYLRSEGRQDSANNVALALYGTLQTQREYHGPLGDASIGTTLNALGIHHHRIGDVENASVYFREGLRVERRLLGPFHPRTVVTLNNLGQSLQQMGDRTGAMRCYKEALKMKVRMDAGEAPDPSYGEVCLPIFATVLYNVGTLHSSNAFRRPGPDISAHAISTSQTQALHSFRLCALLRRHCLGPDHPDLAAALHNMGVLLLESGDGGVGRSLVELREALRIRRAAFGATHPAVLASLRQIGLVLQRWGEFSEDLEACSAAAAA